MEELIDLVDAETGKNINKVISKDIAHRDGLWHKAVHIWIFNKNKNRILLQKRCPLKKLYPNMWDISVGGHVSSGEDCLQASQREVFEELGLKYTEKDFIYLDTIKEEFFYNDINSKEFVSIYIIIDDVNVDNLILQKEEVSKAEWFNKDDLLKLIDDKKIINHTKEFNLIKKIMQ